MIGDADETIDVGLDNAVDTGFTAGVDYDVDDRFFLTSELRYSSQTEIDLVEEGGSGRVSDIDYQPVTLGVGIGIRF